MIHIKKLASQKADKNAKHAVLNINDKCGTCGCVSNITSISDLKVMIGTKDGVLSMYYNCPNCGSRQFLSVPNACKLRKHMVSIGLRTSDLLTFQTKCENAINNRNEIFDMVLYAREKKLAIPDEVYDVDDSYGREILLINTLLDQDVVDSRHEYEAYKKTLPYILSMLQSLDNVKVSHITSNDGRTKYNIIINNVETSIMVDATGKVTGWKSK